MPESKIDVNAILIKSEEWNPQSKAKTKLEELKETVFNLRVNKKLSFTAIKHFLAESEVKTSTAALSNFCRSRFNAQTEERMKTSVAEKLAGLMPRGEDGQTHGKEEA